MQTHFKAKQLCVALTLAMSTIGLTACGGGSKSGGNSGGSNNVPIEKKTDTIKLPEGQWAEVGDTVELVKLSNNGLPLTYKVRTPDTCELEGKYKLTLLKALDKNGRPGAECLLIVNNSGGNRQFNALSVGHRVSIFEKCGDDEMHSERSHLCIPKTISIDPVSTAYVTDINKPLTITLTGYNLKGNLDKFKIETDACSDLKRSEDAVANHLDTDKDNFSIFCTPKNAGTFNLSISQDDTTLFTAKINAKLPTVVTNNQLPLVQTGMITCANNEKTDLACTKEALGDWYGLKQDGEVKTGADFNYSTKKHINPITKEEETCIYDNVTGLLWEAKTDDGGLRDKNWTYSWYDTNIATNAGSSGAKGQDTCGGDKTIGTECNSQTYIAKLNEIKYCGYDDWRVPYADELVSLIDYGHNEPHLLNQQYFPLDKDKFYIYMTATSSHNGNDFFFMYTHNAEMLAFDKDYGSPLHLRAVRSD